MRILAVDYGEKRTGLAISDPMEVIAQPIAVVETNTENILKIINQYRVEKIVIGLPLNMNGSQGESAKSAASFANEIRQKSGIPVEMMDERLTTKQAQRLLIDADMSRGKRKKNIDKVSAALLLESYLQHQKSK
ncbi:MAG: Holliday junction resolvase RuvX [Elusimicrobiota bacterium]